MISKKQIESVASLASDSGGATSSVLMTGEELVATDGAVMGILPMSADVKGCVDAKDFLRFAKTMRASEVAKVRNQTVSNDVSSVAVDASAHFPDWKAVQPEESESDGEILLTLDKLEKLVKSARKLCPKSEDASLSIKFKSNDDGPVNTALRVSAQIGDKQIIRYLLMPRGKR